MRTDTPATPRFSAELESVLRRQATGRRRRHLPHAASALRRLRSVSAGAAHVGAAVAMSTLLLLLAPATANREIQLPAISEPPRAGYLAQFGAGPVSAERTIAMAREAGFEVDVVTTYVADRASHGQIVGMRHVTVPVTAIPVDDPARGPLLIIIGLTVGGSGTTVD